MTAVIQVAGRVEIEGRLVTETGGFSKAESSRGSAAGLPVVAGIRHLGVTGLAVTAGVAKLERVGVVGTRLAVVAGFSITGSTGKTAVAEVP